MNRRSIVVQNGNIPVIPSAPSAWNLTPPDTCSFVWAGILQQGSSDSPPHSAHICFRSLLPFKFSHPFKSPIPFTSYCHLSVSVCNTILFIPPFSTLTSFIFSYIACANTPKLFYQGTPWHVSLNLGIFFSLFHPHDPSCHYYFSFLFGHIFTHKVFMRKASHQILKLCSRDFYTHNHGSISTVECWCWEIRLWLPCCIPVHLGWAGFAQRWSLNSAQDCCFLLTQLRDLSWFYRN